MKAIFHKLRTFILICLFLTSCYAHDDDFDTDALLSENSPQAENLLRDEHSSQNLEVEQRNQMHKMEALENIVFKQEEQISRLEKRLKEKKEVENTRVVYHREESSEKRMKAPISKPSYRPTEPQFDPYKSYAQKMGLAKSLFNQEIWHKAFLAFSKIDRQFDPVVTDGEPLYWMARCWYHLKEYQTAKSLLTRFIQYNRNIPLIAFAKLYLAKIDLATGNREEAVVALKNLVRKYPVEDSSKIATQMLIRLKEQKL